MLISMLNSHQPLLSCCCCCQLLLQHAVLPLQHTFSQLGSHLTHLSFGLGCGCNFQLQLSAPLNRMPALQTLTCQPGFILDSENILYPDLDDANTTNPDVEPNGSSSSESATAAAAAQLVPSLTRLVLNDSWDHGPLLHLFTQPAREGAAAAAAAASRTLLQHLEFNCHGELPFELLNQLEGLRSLKFTVRNGRGVKFTVASCPVTRSAVLAPFDLTTTCAC
jgi:hypothetical protein